MVGIDKPVSHDVTHPISHGGDARILSTWRNRRLGVGASACYRTVVFDVLDGLLAPTDTVMSITWRGAGILRP